jgi:hypothetical protein
MERVENRNEEMKNEDNDTDTIVEVQLSCWQKLLAETRFFFFVFLLETLASHF